MPELGQTRDEIFEMAVQAGVDAEVVVALVGEVEADGELVDAGGAQGQVLLLGHEGPVGNQDSVRQGGAVLDAAHDFDDVVAHQGLAARNLHHAGAQGLHVAAEIGGLEIARFVARAAVIAVFAPAGTRVGDFKGNDDRTIGEPVGRASPDDPEGFREWHLTQVAMVTCGALFSKVWRATGS